MKSSHNITQYRLLSLEEELHLCERKNAGDEAAREKLICHNLRLAAKIAAEFLKKIPSADLNDLISAANLGLVRAVDRYEARAADGSIRRFGLYAIERIRLAVRESIDSQREVGSTSVPQKMFRMHLRMKTFIEHYVREHGHEPSPHEIGDELGLSPKMVAKISAISSGTMSLDATVGADNGDGAEANGYNFLGDTTEIDTRERREDKAHIEVLLGFLYPQERQTILLKHGVGSNAVFDSRQIGAVLGIEEVTVQQIEIRALRKLQALHKMGTIDNGGPAPFPDAAYVRSLMRKRHLKFSIYSYDQ